MTSTATTLTTTTTVHTITVFSAEISLEAVSDPQALVDGLAEGGELSSAFEQAVVDSVDGFEPGDQVEVLGSAVVQSDARLLAGAALELPGGVGHPCRAGVREPSEDMARVQGVPARGLLAAPDVDVSFEVSLPSRRAQDAGLTTNVMREGLVQNFPDNFMVHLGPETVHNITISRLVVRSLSVVERWSDTFLVITTTSTTSWTTSTTTHTTTTTTSSSSTSTTTSSTTTSSTTTNSTTTTSTTTSSSTSTSTTTTTRPEALEVGTDVPVMAGLSNLLVSVLALACVCFCCCVWCRGKSIPVERGRQYIKALGGKRRFIVDRAKNRVGVEEEPDDDGKDHIVWQIDVYRARQVLDASEGETEDGPGLSEEVPGQEEELTEGEEELSDWEQDSDETIVEEEDVVEQTPRPAPSKWRAQLGRLPDVLDLPLSADAPLRLEVRPEGGADHVSGGLHAAGADAGPPDSSRSSRWRSGFGSAREAVGRVNLDDGRSLLAEVQQDLAEVAEQGADAEVGSGGVQPGGHAQLASGWKTLRDTAGEGAAEGGVGLAQVPDARLRPAFRNGSRVEYYSKTNGVWMPGILGIVFTTQAGSPRIEYSIRVESGGRMQNRSDVSLAQMRLPLEDGEVVEFYRKRNGGTWTVAKIYGDKQSTTRGYQIMLLSDQRVMDEVPAQRLRRHFPTGAPVKIYKGPSVGWVPGVVHGASVDEDADAALTPRPAAASAESGGAAPSLDGAAVAGPASSGGALSGAAVAGPASSGGALSGAPVAGPASSGGALSGAPVAGSASSGGASLSGTPVAGAALSGATSVSGAAVLGPASSGGSTSLGSTAVTSPAPSGGTSLGGVAVAGSQPSDVSLGSPIDNPLLSGLSYASSVASSAPRASRDRPPPWSFVPVLAGPRERLIPSYLVMAAGGPGPAV